MGDFRIDWAQNLFSAKLRGLTCPNMPLGNIKWIRLSKVNEVKVYIDHNFLITKKL